MGKVVPFSSRPDQQQVEAALRRAGERFQARLRARELLPAVLAALLDAGEQEAVLAAIRAWGKGEHTPEEVFARCAGLAAARGIHVESGQQTSY